MRSLPLTLALLLAAVPSALAHDTGLHHSHPHLIVGNELLAALLVVAAVGVVVAVQRIVTRPSRSAARRRK